MVFSKAAGMVEACSRKLMEFNDEHVWCYRRFIVVCMSDQMNIGCNCTS